MEFADGLAFPSSDTALRNVQRVSHITLRHTKAGAENTELFGVHAAVS